MTICAGAPAEQSAELYLQGALPEMEAERFEQHYFDCPACLAYLEALQAVRAELARHPAAVPKTPLPFRTSFRTSFRILGAIAALLLVGYVSYVGYRFAAHTAAPTSATQPNSTQDSAKSSQAAPAVPASPGIAEIADLTLPAFAASRLRGEAANPHFEAGMKAYAKGDCTGAADALSRVPANDGQARAALFYAGVCKMHSGDRAAASTRLRKVAAAGDSPQQEAALYYLAQIALAGNDAASARRYLKQTIALHGDFGSKATAELAKLPTEAGTR